MTEDKIKKGRGRPRKILLTNDTNLLKTKGATMKTMLKLLVWIITIIVYVISIALDLILTPFFIIYILCKYIVILFDIKPEPFYFIRKILRRNYGKEKLGTRK